jgi:hypothetical protein
MEPTWPAVAEDTLGTYQGACTGPSQRKEKYKSELGRPAGVLLLLPEECLSYGVFPPTSAPFSCWAGLLFGADGAALSRQWNQMQP